jgi:perosamine synthetase
LKKATRNFSDFIPVAEPALLGNELKYVSDCVTRGWISSAGDYCVQFEKTWSGYCGCEHGMAVSNGTAALQVALDALELEKNDEVILPSFTIISCALAVLRAGARPILVDCDPHTFCIDIGQIEAAITARTRAIMVIHMYGHPVDMDAVQSLAERYNLFVIEDAAQAHGSQYLTRKVSAPRWVRCGGLGTVSTFSFYANKILTTGEGGMVLTNDGEIAERCRALRNLCFGRNNRFEYSGLGYNFRLSNLQAAIGLAQCERIDDILAAKRSIGMRYDELFADQAGIQLQSKQEWARTNYWMYGLVIDDAVPMDAAEFTIQLNKRGIETRRFFKGLHEQTIFQELGLFRDLKFPVTERLWRKGLYVPSGLTLTEAQAQNVADGVRDALSYAR